jgi:hypothetical protein
MERSGIRGCLIFQGLFALRTLRAALRAFNALRAFVGPAGLHPGYSGCVNVIRIQR